MIKGQPILLDRLEQHDLAGEELASALYEFGPSTVLEYIANWCEQEAENADKTDNCCDATENYVLAERIREIIE